MRAAWLTLGLLLLTAVPAVAKETPDEASPTPEQEADLVLDAIKASDGAALKGIAAADDPDPWITADVLCARKQYDAADAFAKASPRPDVERLPSYVASRRGKADDPKDRAAWIAAEAAGPAGHLDEAVAKLEGVAPKDESVLAVLILETRSQALLGLGKLDAAASDSLAGWKLAAKMGWLARAAFALVRAGAVAFQAGDYKAALDRWQQSLEIHEKRAYDLGTAGVLGNIGRCHFQLGDMGKALAAHTRALKMWQDLGLRAAEAQTLSAIGEIHSQRGSFPAARDVLQQALVVYAEVDDPLGRGNILAMLGLTLAEVGDAARGLEMEEEARKLFAAAGDRSRAGGALTNAGSILERRGEYVKARAALDEALATARDAHNLPGEAAALNVLGALFTDLRDYSKAREHESMALKLYRDLSAVQGVAATLGQIGEIDRLLGEFREAMNHLEQSQQAAESIEDRKGIAAALQGIALVYLAIGDNRKALGLFQNALTLEEAMGRRAGIAVTLGNLGVVHSRLDENEKALADYRKALAILEEIGDRAAAARALGNIADACNRLGKPAEALKPLDRSQGIFKDLKEKAGLVGNTLTYGEVYLNGFKNPEKAVEYFEQARAEARRLGALDLVVAAHVGLAQARLALGKPDLALETAIGAGQYLDTLAHGQGEEQGASARAQYADLYEVGLRAATALNDVGAATYFLESSRAGMLLESLGGRDALQTATLPEALQAAALKARERESSAFRAHMAALIDSDDRETHRKAKAELDAARDDVKAAIERITRESKAEASVLFPHAAGIEEIRAWLQPGEALVEYGLTSVDAVALVATRDGDAKVIRLAKTAEVTAACDALDFTDKDTEPKALLEKLSSLVIEPLHLDAKTTRVLISSEGALSYIPFSLLFPKREVAYVPSGTTYGLLTEERSKRGAGILALADPDYSGTADPKAAALLRRGRGLRQLPGARAEATVIADKVVVGRDVTTIGLREVVKEKPRWHGLHIACHGLVDPERPMLCSLALTTDAGAEGGGFLTALDVCRMKLPTDLAVLSACETMKGKIYRGEGIVGLARAFMLAGAPRVIVSLWKVDDEATHTLMLKFYELWSPKEPKAGSPSVGTAEALRQAQEFVRTHEIEVPDEEAAKREGKPMTKRVRNWEHPYYWAAWVLWGLPD